MDVNLYKLAAVKKLRFPTTSGELSVEQLFDLPLQSTRSLSLDGLAIATNLALRDVGGVESFVTGKPTVGTTDMELRLEILKDVIADKLAANAASEKRRHNAEKRRKILDLIASKDEAELAGKTREELMAELAAIGD